MTVGMYTIITSHYMTVDYRYEHYHQIRKKNGSKVFSEAPRQYIHIYFLTEKVF